MPGLLTPRRRGLLAGLLVGLLVVCVVVAVVFAAVGGTTGLLVGLGTDVVLLAVVASAGAVVVLTERQVRLVAERSAGLESERHEQLVRIGRQTRRRAHGNAKSLELLERRQGKQTDRLSELLRQVPYAVDERVQSATNLRAMVTVQEPLPVMGLYTASADLLVALLDEFLQRRPRTVVEAGSGISTLVLALAARQYDVPTRIVALEHLPQYAEQTRALLRRHGVDHLAEVKDAPLVPVGLPGHDTPWYDPVALADLTEVGLVLVDGPPKSTGDAPRFPMLPLLAERLSEHASVLVDDTRREDDAVVVERWQEMYPDLVRFDLPLEKGAILLRRG